VTDHASNINISHKWIAFFKHAIVETLLCLGSFLLIPHEAGGTGPFGFSPEKLGLISLVVLLFIGFSVLLVISSSEALYAKKLKKYILIWSSNPNQLKWINNLFFSLLIVSAFMVLSAIFGTSYFFGPVIIRLLPLSVLLLLISMEAVHKFTTFPDDPIPITAMIFIIVLLLSQWFQWLNTHYTRTSIILIPFALAVTTLTGGIIGRFLASITIQHFKNTIPTLILVVFGILYLRSAINFAPINREINRFDQYAYVNFIRKVNASNYTYTGDRNQMPTYPFLQALFNNTNENRMHIFQRGKFINILLSLLILTLLYFIVQILLPKMQSFIFILITAFSLFIYKSVYVQAELLYYFLSFVSFLLVLQMFKKPKVYTGIFTGLFLGFSYLTKASILPLVGLFIFFFVFNECYKYNSLRQIKPLDKRDWQIFRRHLITIAVAVGSFLAIIFPYIQESKNNYTQYFYNVNTTFYFWNDSWDEIKKETMAYGDRVGWPDMQPDRIPSLKRYIRIHSLNDAIQRLGTGIGLVFEILGDPYGGINYLLLTIIYFFLIAVTNRETVLILLRKDFLVILFTVSYFVVTLLLVSWYIIILTQGDRFVYAMYLPILFVIINATQKIIDLSPKQIKILSFKRANLLQIAFLVMFFLVTFDFLMISPTKLTTDIFGW
jgi:hypothetical protein